MAVGFPPQPVYPAGIDSDYTLFLVYNTTEAALTEDNDPWSEEVSIQPRDKTQPEIWADNGFANIEGELFYYDAVEKNADGKVCKLKRCARNLGGTQTKFQPAGTMVRSFVVAEHHNQLRDGIILAERFIGENFSEDQTTLDWRIRHLQAVPIIADDYGCPDVNFHFTVKSSDPSTGTVAHYQLEVIGSYQEFTLSFGDGTSTSSIQEGDHTYPPNATIDPVVTFKNGNCQVVQTPIQRDKTDSPQPEQNEVLFDIPNFPDFLFPNITVTTPSFPEPDITLPPFQFPCIDLTPFGISPVRLPSVIMFQPSINLPSLIDFSPISIPDFIGFGDVNIPSFIGITPITLPSIITITGNFPDIPSVINVNIPNISIPPINIPQISFPDIKIPSIQFPTIGFSLPSFPTIQISLPSFPIIQISLPSFPTIDVSMPSIPPIDVTVPSIPPIDINWSGYPPNIPVYWGDTPLLVIDWGDPPPLFVDWYDPPELIVYWDHPPQVPINWSGYPTLHFDWSGYPTLNFDWSGYPSLPVNWSGYPTLPIDWSGYPTIPVNWSGAPTYIPVSCARCPDIGISWGTAPTVQVNWGNPPTVQVNVTVTCPASTASLAIADPLAALGENRDLEVQYDFTGFPSEIKMLPPEIPNIRIEHDLPSEILVRSPVIDNIKFDVPEFKDIKILPPETQLTIEAIGIPDVIRLEPTLPIPQRIELAVPVRIPESITLDASGVPDVIRIEGLPEVIRLEHNLPSVIKLEMPEKPEIELVYKGPPIPVQVQLDVQKLVGDAENLQCVAIVPCARK